MRGFLDARRAVQLVALALAVAAAAYLLGFRQTVETATDAGTATTPATLVDVNGRWVVWLLLAPVLLVAIHALWPGHRRTVAIAACTVLLFAFCVAGALTVGLFFMPALLVGGLALLVPARPLRRPRVASQPS